MATIADFASEGEFARWQPNNVGPKTKAELTPGPNGIAAFHAQCVYEPQLSPQHHSPAPYMTFKRPLDGAALARLDGTRLCFWHKGDRVQVVFNEKDKGDAYYAAVEASGQWRQVSVPFPSLSYGWSYGPNGKGTFDLSRMASLHLAVSPPPGESREFWVASFSLERSPDDLDPRVFRGGMTPAGLELYPRDVRLPVNRSQPLLAIVSNEECSGLHGVEVEFSLAGPGRLCAIGAREGREHVTTLRVLTNAEGKAQARYVPSPKQGESCVITARVPGRPVIRAQHVRFEMAAAFRKVRLGPDGFFVRPDGSLLVPLGSLFLPWWARMENGEPQQMSRLSVIAADESEQRAWFSYLQDNGVNYVRGYWGWGEPLPFGPDGADVPHLFCVDGEINEPVVAALEKALAVGGDYGIGFSLTIANSARRFIAPHRLRPEHTARTKRDAMFDACSSVRNLVQRLMLNPHVWAYELTNEQGAMTVEWSDLFVRTIKELDEHTPVMISHGGGALRTADPLLWMTRTSIDIYQPHLYPGINMTQGRDDIDAGLLQDVHYNAMRGPKPWFLGEAGGFGTHPPLGPEPDAETQRYLGRDCIWFALLNRSLGASIWGIKHHATTEFRLAAEIAPLVDWPALAAADAPVGIAVPRDVSTARFFCAGEGAKALCVLADYARWGLQHGVPLDVVLDNSAYAMRRSALEPFSPPEVKGCLEIGTGYQMKVRLSRTGDLVVGYLRNVSGITLYKPEPWPGSRRTVTGAHIRERAPAAPRVDWQLPQQTAPYSLTVWDLDTGTKTERRGRGSTGSWEQAPTTHDFVLLWRREQTPLMPNLTALRRQSVVALGEPARFQQLFAKLRQGRVNTIGFIGGSITTGAKSGGLAFSWPKLVFDWFTDAFPETSLEYVNAAIGATGTDFGAHRVQRDLLESDPDVVFVEFAVNDGRTPACRETLEGMLRQILKSRSQPAVMLLFTMASGGSNAQQWHSEVGNHYALPMVSFRDAYWPEIEAGRLQWDDVIADTVHPNRQGHACCADLVTSRLEQLLADFPGERVPTPIRALPAPLTDNAYEHTAMYTAASLTPTRNAGWTLVDEGKAARFGKGWTSTTPGSVLEFEVTGTVFSILFHRIKADMGRIAVQVDDGQPRTFDAWFDQTWGGYSARGAMPPVPVGTHHLRLELLPDKADGSTGHRFELQAVLAAGVPEQSGK